MKLSELTVEHFKVGKPANTIYDDSLITGVVFSGISDILNHSLYWKKVRVLNTNTDTTNYMSIWILERKQIW